MQAGIIQKVCFSFQKNMIGFSFSTLVQDIKNRVMQNNVEYNKQAKLFCNFCIFFVELIFFLKYGLFPRTSILLVAFSFNDQVIYLIISRLFQTYRKVKCEGCDNVPDDPAICLVCCRFLCFRGVCCVKESIYECVQVKDTVLLV